MLRLNEELLLTKDFAGALTLQNFSAPEDHFVWSSGRWCEIHFDMEELPHPSHAKADLVIDLDVFKSPPHVENQTISIYLNGLRVGTKVIKRRTIHFVNFSRFILMKSENVIVIDTPDSRSPVEFGGSDDRHLGIQLFSLQIRTES